jgi:hypothetical protein
MATFALWGSDRMVQAQRRGSDDCQSKESDELSFEAARGARPSEFRRIGVVGIACGEGNSDTENASVRLTSDQIVSGSNGLRSRPWTRSQLGIGMNCTGSEVPGPAPMHPGSPP